MRSLHLCAGAGGGLLADLILGHRIVGAVERDEFCQTVLRARQRDGFLPAFPIFDDVRAFDGRPWRGSVDLLAGGIPCQGFSCSGLQLGEFDPRNLWPDALRILRECRAPWFFLENVDRLTSFDYWGVILQDLASAGYDARWCVLAAGDVGAPHLRKRIWLLATDTESYRRNAWRPESDAARQAGVVESGEQMADAHGQRRSRGRDQSAHRDPRSGGEAPIQMADASVRGRDEPSAARPGDDSGGGCGTRSHPPVAAGGCGFGGALAYPESERRGEARPTGAGSTQRPADGGPVGNAASTGSSVGEIVGSDPRQEFPAALGTGGRPAESDVGRMADGVADRLDEAADTERGGWWSIERGLPRVAGKQPYRADRLRGLGNGQVAICCAIAFKLLSGGVI